MSFSLDTNHRIYPSTAELTQFNGEAPFDYKAQGTLESVEHYSSLARLSGLHAEILEETYLGVKVELLYEERYYDKVGRELIY